MFGHTLAALRRVSITSLLYTTTARIAPSGDCVTIRGSRCDGPSTFPRFRFSLSPWSHIRNRAHYYSQNAWGRSLSACLLNSPALSTHDPPLRAAHNYTSCLTNLPRAMSATTSTSVSTNLSSDAASINSRADLRSGGRLKRWMHTQKQLFISCFSPDITPIAPRAHLRSKRDTLPSSTSTVRLSRSETCLPTSEIPRICGATDSTTSNPASALHLEIPPSPMSFLTTTSASFDWSNMPHSAVASSDHGRSFSPTDALPARTSSELEGRFQAMMNWQAKQRCAPVELAQSTMAVNECGDDCVDPILPPSPSPLGYKRVPFREVDEQEVDKKTSVGHSTWSASEARARGRLVAWWSNQSLRSHYNGHEVRQAMSSYVLIVNPCLSLSSRRPQSFILLSRVPKRYILRPHSLS